MQQPTGDPEEVPIQVVPADPANRRVHPRVVQPPVELSGLWGRVQDISLTGISVVFPDPLEIGSRLDLVLTDLRTNDQRWIAAEVVWCEEGRAGLRWLDLSDGDREWIVERFSAWLSMYQAELRCFQG